MLKIMYDPRINKFIAAEGAQIIKEDFVFGDKWNCRTRYDGSVRCTSCDTINGKYYEICLKINKKGLVTISKVEGGKQTPIRCFRVKNWPITGIITLTGGPIVSRNAYFNDIKSYM